MPLPPFNDQGVMPPGRHPADAAEIKAVLVDAFPDESSRGDIFAFWKKHRTAIRGLAKVLAQWMDGSFVTDKESPGDVDLFTQLDGPAVDALDSTERIQLDLLIAGPATRGTWRCDSYVVAVYPPTHPAHHIVKPTLDYWNDWFGHTAPDDPRGLVPKGFVDVQ